MSRYFLTILFLFAVLTAPAQKAKREPQKNEQEVRDMVAFLQYILNTVGNASTSARDKDVLITESFTKIFRDAKVQIQDDLDEDRTVITNKDVPAYLKDVDFFFKDVEFSFDIEKIEEKSNDNGTLFYKVTLTRNLKGVTADGKNINNTSPRFIEINYDPKAQDLKIVSIYTKQYDQKKALLAWWSDLSYEWKVLFLRQINTPDTVTLEEIQTITAIDTLDLSNNRYIVSLDPLAQLSQLQYLNISSTAITDISPIRNLTELTDLNLSNTNIGDVSGLRYALKLSKLNINHTPITDLTVLEKLANLETLAMANCKSKQYGPLALLPRVKDLNLSGSGIADPAPFDSLKALSSLDLSGTMVSDINFLANTTQLSTLNLDSTRVKDFGALSNLKNLTTLSVNNTSFADFEPVQELVHLQRIYCDGTQVNAQSADSFMDTHPNALVVFDSEDLRSWYEDLSAVWKDVLKRNARVQVSPTNDDLAAITNLDSININNYVSIKNLSPLTRLPKLRVLLAANSGIQDLVPLRTQSNLQRLDISGTLVSDLSPLHSLENLKMLSADRTKVQSIDTLSRKGVLKFLYIDGVGLTDEHVRNFLQTHSGALVIYKSPRLEKWWEMLSDDWKAIFRTQLNSSNKPQREDLHRLISLPKIHFENVSINSLEPLREFVQLKQLDFSATSIQNISLIGEMKSLTSLNVHDNPIRNLAPLRSLINLEHLNIANTPVKDIEPISSLKNLKSLNCAGTPIKKLNDISDLKRLEYLDCANTGVRKLNVLYGLPLKTLKCYNAPVSKSELKKFKKRKPDCEVVFYR